MAKKKKTSNIVQKIVIYIMLLAMIGMFVVSLFQGL